MNYLEKLKDPRWQKKRLKVFERDNWTCQCCGDKTKTLHVHHLFYTEGLNPWEEEEQNLITLCEDCHELETRIRDGNEQCLLMYLRLAHFTCRDISDLFSLVKVAAIKREDIRKKHQEWGKENISATEKDKKTMRPFFEIIAELWGVSF